MNYEDDEEFGSLYECGHWIWDDKETDGLVFVSERPPEQIETIQFSTKTPTGKLQFRDDIDLIEQMRYRRRYQRKIKPGQGDIITLQDVKDIALYTAPVNILSPVLINMLHLPTTERFIRALILFCEYYLQIADEMASRILEQETKIRTPNSTLVESAYQENLADLRLLVAKEYEYGGADTKKFHHMGMAKKSRSLSDKDARFFETLLRMCVQIVWLALGRKCFNQIELEINRIFKTEIFNSVEHTIKTGYISKMTKEERIVLLGHCIRRDQKLCTLSPLINEVFCHRDIDYRIMSLGVIKTPETTRLKYMLIAISAPEEMLETSGVVLGIIGMRRSTFDTMLKPLPVPQNRKSRGSVSSDMANNSSKSSASVRRSTTAPSQKLYPDVVLPEKKTHEQFFPATFSEEPEQIRLCSETQRRRWQARLKRMLNYGRLSRH